MFQRRAWVVVGFVLLAGFASAQNATGPGYQIVLRSHHGEATPHRTKDAQTGGGSINIEQPEPHTIIVTMGGSAVAGSDFHGSSAGINFALDQDLDIITTRPGVRAPRIGMVGRVIGTLQVTDPGKCGKGCVSADQGPATATLTRGDTSLLSVNVRNSGVGVGQETFVNFRDGPVESAATTGSYKLHTSFRIGVSQGKGVFHRQYAVADFDPAPQLDAFWADALKPFRAVPRSDFGFRLVVRVVEEAGR